MPRLTFFLIFATALTAAAATVWGILQLVPGDPARVAMLVLPATLAVAALVRVLLPRILNDDD